MKKAVSMLMFFVLTLVFNTTICAQHKSNAIIQRTELIVPFSTVKADSTNLIIFEKEELMKVERLICENKDYQIIEYSFTFIGEDGFVSQIKSSNNIFTPEMKKTISNLKSGKHVWIEEIYCKGLDNKIVEIQRIPITIK